MKNIFLTSLLALPWLLTDFYFFIMSIILLIRRNKPIRHTFNISPLPNSGDLTVILIPIYNNATTALNSLIPQLLNYLDKQQNLPMPVTLIDSSTDGTTEKLREKLNIVWSEDFPDRKVARHQNLTLIHLKNRQGGKAWAINKIARDLNKKYFAILDTGWVLNFENFSKATHYLENNSEHVYAQMARISTGKKLNLVGGIDQVSIEYRHQLENRVRVWQDIPVTIHGTAVVIRTQDFQNMHGFDDSVLSEDVDLTVRFMLSGKFGAALCGLGMEYDPCNHLRQFFWQKARWAEGRSQMLKKYAAQIIRSSYFSGKQKLFWIYYLAYFGRCVGFSLLLAFALYGIASDIPLLTKSCLVWILALLTMRVLNHIVTLWQRTNHVPFICRLLEPFSFYGIGLIYTYTFFVGLFRSKGVWRIVEPINAPK